MKKVRRKDSETTKKVRRDNEKQEECWKERPENHRLGYCRPFYFCRNHGSSYRRKFEGCRKTNSETAHNGDFNS